MASVNETGCLNLTWKIENFNLFFSATGDRYLLCPVFKTDTNEGRDLWQLSLKTFSDCRFLIFLTRYKEWHTLEKCEISLKSITREVSLDCQNLGKFLIRAINDKIMFFKDQVCPETSTITICCKIWLQFQNPEDRIIRTVLHKDSLFWNIKNRLCTQKTYIENDNTFLGITLKDKNITNTKLFTVFVLPSKVVCTLVQCQLYFIKDDQGSIGTIQCDWPYVRWETEITFKENASSSVELKLDYIAGVHVFDNCPASAISTFARSSGPLGEDLLLLYKEKSLNDATLTTEGKSFSAHRSILAARSPVFRAMFEKDEMKEGRSGIVDIDDLDSGTVDRMLVFLYSDSLEGVQWEEASALYYAADKYAIHTLKKRCADILKAGLTVDNVCDLLVLADKHSDKQLMKSVVGFLCNHEEVISYVRWEELEDRNPRLTSKITREILLNKCKQERKEGK